MYEIHNLSYRYPDGTASLKNINLHIQKGEIILLCGPNGGGKSTLIKCMLGIIPEYTGGQLNGSITYKGKPISQYRITELAGKVGVVLQDPENQISNLTVLEEVTFGVGNQCLPLDEIHDRTSWALNKVYLGNHRNSSVFALSGGQLQRLSIASLIAMHPKTLLFDEPLANLDPHGVNGLVSAIAELKNTVDTIVIATHWLDPFLDLATRVIILSEGAVKEDLAIDELYTKTDVLRKNGVEIPHIFRLWDTLERQGIRARGKSLADLENLPVAPLRQKGAQPQRMLIQGNNISHTYPTGEQPFCNVSFNLAVGTRTGLVGPNGAGKTTLSRIIAGLIKPTNGKLTKYISKVGVVLQNPGFSFLTANVLDEITYGSSMTNRDAVKILENCGLERFQNHSPFELSGGQQRVLALAIAQLSKASLLILDEPTAGLDSFYTEHFRKEIQKFDGSVLFISHDPRVIGTQVDDVMILGNETVLYHGPVRNLTRELMIFLGYPLVNPTVKIALSSISKGIPLVPEELEVKDAACI